MSKLQRLQNSVARGYFVLQLTEYDVYVMFFIDVTLVTKDIDAYHKYIFRNQFGLNCCHNATFGC